MTAFALPRPQPHVSAGMNVTPLVDVLLVLLVIFMLAVPATTQRLPLSLPSACRHDCPSPPAPARLSIKRTGELYWNGSAITAAGLRDRLALLARQPDATLEIRPEAQAPYALLTDALAAARNAQVRRIGVVSDR